MQVAKTIRLLWTFYKSFVFASMLITLCCVWLFWQYGLSIIAGILWFKLATLALLFFFINDYKQREYYYYQNLGISKGFLWTATLLFDFTLLIFLLTQIHHFK